MRPMPTLVLCFIFLMVLLAPASMGQTQRASGQVVNVNSVVRGGMVQVFYDLVSDDPNAEFTVVLGVSNDGGLTFAIRPQAVSGDVGPGVRPGTGKQITWEAARDVESIDLDRFQYRVVAEPLRPVPALASLRVASTPPGATVMLDGEVRGVTPLEVTGLAAGEHRLVVRRDEYLENSRTVNLKAGVQEQVEVALTSGQATKPVSGRGNPLKWILPLVGGAAGAGVAIATRGGADGDNGGPITETLTLTITAASTCTFGGQTLNFCVAVERTTTQGGGVTASLTWGDPDANLDLYLVDPDAVSILASSRNASGTFESVSGSVNPGQRYRIDVENISKRGTVSFTLSLTRPR